MPEVRVPYPSGLFGPPWTLKTIAASSNVVLVQCQICRKSPVVIEITATYLVAPESMESDGINDACHSPYCGDGIKRKKSTRSRVSKLCKQNRTPCCLSKVYNSCRISLERTPWVRYRYVVLCEIKALTRNHLEYQKNKSVVQVLHTSPQKGTETRNLELGLNRTA
jgi:hypothetical protein